MARVTRKDDCEIIEIPNHIKNKVTVKGSGRIDFDAIERAEAALMELSVQFDDWLENEVNRLCDARARVMEEGLESPAGEELFLAAHDIKGQGETFGYPLAGVVCSSLCKLIECTDDPSIIPLDIINHHVDAVRRILHDGIKTNDHFMGRAVADRLVDVVLEFVEHHKTTRQPV